MSAEFIKMISELHEERFKMHLVELVKNQTPCGVFFSFGFNSSRAAKNVQMIIKAKVNLTCAIVLDTVQEEQLKDLIELPVVTLDNVPFLNEKPKTVLILNELRDPAFIPYFAQYGIKMIKFIQNDNFSPVMKHLPEIFSVYEMLGSDESKKVFRAVIKGRLTGRVSEYRFAPEPQYFLKGFTPNMGDIAIDGGAYDGATALKFNRCGAKVYSFEMDAKNYQNCTDNLKSLKTDITLENLGLSDKEGEENYYSSGTGSRKNVKGTVTGKFIDLDTYVLRKNLPRVDYIKLDIEGAELEMLHGAAKTIARCKPKMAVSAYHKSEDLWTLAPYIKSLCPDYKFEFRHYLNDCTNYSLNDNERAVLKRFGLSYLLPSHCEMVLYCR